MSVHGMNVSQNAILLGTAAVLATCAAVWWKRKAQRNRQPTNWKRVGEISELLLYPIKSGRGVLLKEAECTTLGLKTTDSVPDKLKNLRDRFFIVYNESDNTFTTCRKYSNLLLLDVSYIDKNEYLFQAPDVPQFRLKIPEKETTTLTMWFEEKIEGIDCGDEVAKWITTYLKKEGTALRVAYYHPKDCLRRSVTIPPMDMFSKYYKRMQSHYTGAFSDISSYMLISESSINDLKAKLPSQTQKLTPKQFRPNFVVRGTKPYEEDEWDWIKIGENVVLRGFKPCTRCVVTTMDPETGIREPKYEPLRTMKTYRQVTHPQAKKLEGDSPAMGLYVGLQDGGGIVKVGDPVYIGYH